MSIQECTKNKFLKSVENHKLTIKKDDGLYRHLHLSDGSSNRYYEIITYPNGLMIRGDMGSYVFERLEDMFRFFRNNDKDWDINSGYWTEKCKSESIFGNGIREFSTEDFKQCVKDSFESFYEEEIEEGSFQSERDYVWEEIEDEVLNTDESGEWDYIHRVNNFYLHPAAYYDEDDNRRDIKKEDRRVFSFDDFWETSTFYRKTYHYIWCLYAIVFAIRKYDEIKK